MISGLAHRAGPVLVRARGDISLAADDRLDAGTLRFLIKFNRSEKIAVIGHSHRRHFEFRRFFHQLLHPDGPVEERVFGMEVKMNERIAGHLVSLKRKTFNAQRSTFNSESLSSRMK